MQLSQTELNPIEWQVVAVALNDASNRICVSSRPNWLTSLRLALAGKRPFPPLADPRLEALRAFVDYTRRHRRVNERLARKLAAHGFNERQVKAIALLSA